MAQSIIVAGNVPIEWLAYPVPASLDGDTWIEGSVGLVRRTGGAALLADLLRQAKPYHNHNVLGPSREPDLSNGVHSIIDLVPSKSVSDGTTYKMERQRHVCKQCALRFTGLDGKTDVRILVLEDPAIPGDEPQGSEDSCKELLRAARPQLLIYKMARPLATGKFWDTVRRGPVVDENNNQDSRRLIVIVDADDLRAEGIELSRHLSWERTAEDFVQHIASNGRLDTLVSCAHLIIRFDCDGIIYYQGRTADPPTLYFDSENAEGDFIQSHSGPMAGLSTAFTAGLVSSLAKTFDSATSNESNQLDDSIGTAIREGVLVGLRNARRLASTGFRRNTTDNEPDYPSLEVVEDPSSQEKIASVRVPVTRISQGSPWSILLDVMGDPAEIARYIVRDGPREVLSHVPTACFGRLMTADRHEIESFRSITNLVQEYLRAPPMLQARPLSIGVFGPPGSGKSFGVMEVIETAARGRPVKRLDFNLSQFADYSDLLAAFQLIRDRALSGILPLVLFDEFDASLDGSRLGWLRYFLAPMQDGKFLDHGQMHPLGAAILIFIGGTSPTFAKFTVDTEPDQFAAAKGPDFVSRLRGYVNVVGPDPTSEHDRMYPIRRAILLRALLEKRLLMKGKRILVDDAVLNGLLTVPTFHHGARSLEAILAMSRVTGQNDFQRAALPSETQLNLHVDSEKFMSRVRHQHLPDELRSSVAKRLHGEYQNVKRKMAKTDTELDSDRSMFSWNKLDEELKESNRLAADDIVNKLRMIECYIAEKVVGGDAVAGFTDPEVEMLAQREHERYNAERLQQHWRLGPRDTSRKTSPFLKPWSDLEPNVQDIDRALVRCIPAVLADCNYQVCRLKKGAAQVQAWSREISM
ncbi:hypothetical protein MRS44_003961 [Fusarium solani]|uniref:uncharacterized protein n=1 Tax=Fusarium solani TaxID=169388 RepID=UPI0032C3FDB8|nr:hypothetical protein MRS44_003961 [Fusarium solani]